MCMLRTWRIIFFNLNVHFSVNLHKCPQADGFLHLHHTCVLGSAAALIDFWKNIFMVNHRFYTMQQSFFIVFHQIFVEIDSNLKLSLLHIVMHASSN